MARSRGAATYVLSTPRTSHRAPPCIWTFLSSLGENGFFSILLEKKKMEGSGFLRSEPGPPSIFGLRPTGGPEFRGEPQQGPYSIQTLKKNGRNMLA